MYKHFPHTMYYTWLLMIVISCTAAQRCADSSNINTHMYNRTTFRVSDEDFYSLFANAVVTTSSIHCVTLCARNPTNTYYESNTRRCRCQGLCVSYYPVLTGTNCVEKFSALGKSLCINFHFYMSSLCCF